MPSLPRSDFVAKGRMHPWSQKSRELSRPTYALVNMQAIAHNYQVVKSTLAGQAKVLAVVKADAYGHDLLTSARALRALGVDYFGVARLEEALALREAGIDCDILLMAGILPGGFEIAIAQQLTVGVIDFAMLELLEQTAIRLGQRAKAHLKVDTGMHRLGIPADEFQVHVGILKKLRQTDLSGIFSHLANADHQGDNFVFAQLESFLRCCDLAAQTLPRVKWLRHLANSDGIFRSPKLHLDMVRPGISLYGYCRRAGEALLPAMQLRSRVIQIKEVPKGGSVGYDRHFRVERASRVAVLPLGYADGFSRAYSGSSVQFEAGKAVIVGRICMDMLMVDVTELPTVRVGDEGLFFGRQDNREVSVYDLARQSGTTHYQVLTSIQSRVPRFFQEMTPEGKVN